MLRAWLESPLRAGQASVTLSAEESGHLVRSLRGRRGDSVVLLDGAGLVAEGRLASADGEAAVVELLKVSRAPLPSPAIVLAQAMPKGGTMDDLVRAVAEAGVAEVHPLMSGRSEVRLDPERAAAKAARWRDQAIEACKQCGNPWLARVAEPRSFRAWCDALPPPVPGEARLVASLEIDAEPVARVDLASAARVCWLVGPEGDLTPEEYAAARLAGFRPVTLGPTVLRAENAALACVVATQILSQR
ncbi:MAG: RsmE family RNA methyltransferase [Opitutia bacterium]